VILSGSDETAEAAHSGKVAKAANLIVPCIHGLFGEMKTLPHRFKGLANKKGASHQDIGRFSEIFPET
jgi:hypothetical protein